MFKKFLPSQILSLNFNFFKTLIFLTLFFLIIGLIYALFFSPPDYLQGDAVRIMYVHVPASILSICIFAMISVASIGSLIFKIKMFPLVAKSLAPLGLVFTLVSIVTGSLWGKPTWGTWWVWDARLTSMFLLLIFYLIYIASWKFINNYNKAVTVSSFIAIIGGFNLPVIKYSVNWWNTLHQTSSISLSSPPTIHYTMLIPLIIVFFGMILYSLLIFLMKYKTEIIKFKLNKKNKRK